MTPNKIPKPPISQANQSGSWEVPSALLNMFRTGIVSLGLKQKPKFSIPESLSVSDMKKGDTVQIIDSDGGYWELKVNHDGDPENPFMGFSPVQIPPGGKEFLFHGEVALSFPITKDDIVRGDIEKTGRNAQITPLSIAHISGNYFDGSVSSKISGEIKEEKDRFARIGNISDGDIVMIKLSDGAEKYVGHITVEDDGEMKMIREDVSLLDGYKNIIEALLDPEKNLVVTPLYLFDTTAAEYQKYRNKIVEGGFGNTTIKPDAFGHCRSFEEVRRVLLVLKREGVKYIDEGGNKGSDYIDLFWAKIMTGEIQSNEDGTGPITDRGGLRTKVNELYHIS